MSSHGRLCSGCKAALPVGDGVPATNNRPVPSNRLAISIDNCFAMTVPISYEITQETVHYL